LSNAEPGRAPLARLLREVAADRAAMARRSKEVRDVLGRWGAVPPPYEWTVVGAVALHGWYTGLETLCERALRILDGEVPAGPDGHRRLLSQAMTDLEGVRPAVLPAALEADLGSLLGFRHFFRHAYGAELDPERLLIELRRFTRIEGPVATALDDFVAFLEATERALRG